MYSVMCQQRAEEEENGGGGTGGLPQCSNDRSLIFCSESSLYFFLSFILPFPLHRLRVFDFPAYFIERPLLILDSSTLINRIRVWKST